MIRAALGVVVALLVLGGLWYFFKSTNEGKSVAEQGGKLAEQVKAAPPQLPPLDGWSNPRPGNSVPAPAPEVQPPFPSNPNYPPVQQPVQGQPIRETHVSAGGTRERPFDPTAIEPSVRPPQATEYTVQSGDSLWTISKKQYGSSKYVDLIAQANRMSPNKGLKIGQTLIIPPIKPAARPVNPRELDADCEADNAAAPRTSTPPTQTVRAPENSMPPTLNRTFRQR